MTALTSWGSTTLGPWGTAALVLAFILAVRIKGALKTRGLRLPLTMPALKPLDLRQVPGSDAGFLERGSRDLRDLGCRHLLDYESQVGVATLRSLHSSYVSSDGQAVASLVQQFSRSFANDYVVFTTWFKSGRRAITTASPITGPAINPALLVTPLPNERDAGRLARAHARVVGRLRRAGEEPLVVSAPEDLARLQSAARARELEELAKIGLVQIEGDAATTTSRMAWAILRHGLTPLRPGLDPLSHLWRIAGSAAVAGILLSLVLGLRPDGARLGVSLAGIALGAVYGYSLWHHALLWTLVVPAPLVWVLTGDASLAGRAEALALTAMLIGFYTSAARNANRGRRAIPQARS